MFDTCFSETVCNKTWKLNRSTDFDHWCSRINSISLIFFCHLFWGYWIPLTTESAHRQCLVQSLRKLEPGFIIPLKKLKSLKEKYRQNSNNKRDLLRFTFSYPKPLLVQVKMACFYQKIDMYWRRLPLGNMYYVPGDEQTAHTATQIQTLTRVTFLCVSLLLNWIHSKKNHVNYIRLKSVMDSQRSLFISFSSSLPRRRV